MEQLELPCIAGVRICEYILSILEKWQFLIKLSIHLTMTQEFYSWVKPNKTVNIYSKKTYTQMFIGTKKLETPMTGMKESWCERTMK